MASLKAGWVECITRLCRSFNQSPTDDTLRALIYAPKLGYQAHFHLGTKAVLEALAQYPNIPTPLPPPRGIPSANRVTRASRLIGQGRVGAAARALTSETPIAPSCEETEAELDRLHPVGDPNPFSHLNNPPNRPSALTFTEEQLASVIKSFDRGTASGIDGWTPPLIELVAEEPDFKRAMISLFFLVVAGKAPCRDLLCSSTLTTLTKHGGPAIRPVAVGSFFYRLVMKAALRAKPVRPTLLPTQFGVGTPGGVEPIIHWIEHVMTHTPAEEHDSTYVTVLDFSNAFNSISRKDMATAVARHAPHLLALARWSYGAPSLLLSHPDRSTKPVRQSSEGVKQGDPTGPFFFSVTVRDTLDSLARHLGQQVLAYLDDVVTVGTDAHALDKIDAFFKAEDVPLTLNRTKCVHKSLAEIRRDGLPLLGSLVGPLVHRRRFLADKIAQERTRLDLLPSMSRQEALLLLRSSFSLNLAHLLRSLRPDGLEDLWREYDDLIYSSLASIRGQPQPPLMLEVDDAVERQLVSLPAKMGGIGLLSCVERAPIAWAAARDSAHAQLHSFVDGIDPPEDSRSQHLRHQHVLQTRLRSFLTTLNTNQKVRLAENASVLGRAWLGTLPTRPSLRLRDSLVSGGLFHRAMGTPSVATCTACGSAAQWAHEDACSELRTSRLLRHDHIKVLLADAFRSIEGVSSRLEPAIPSTVNLYNDVRAQGPPGSDFVPVDVDITATTLFQGIHRATLEAASRVDTHLLPDPMAPYLAAVMKVLEKSAARKDKKQASSTADAFSFVPFVLSAGGILLDTTLAALNSWRRHLSASAFGTFMRGTSCALLEGREPRLGVLTSRPRR